MTGSRPLAGATLRPMCPSAETRSLSVVIAPDEFGGTLTASEAAKAIAEGWRSARPGDRLTLLPQSDGGPGFVDVLHDAGVVDVEVVAVAGPLGDRVDASIGVGPDDTFYLEAAQACGLALLGRPPSPETAMAASTSGVGELLRHAAAAGARRIVVGLGGSATTDGGRGALEALGGVDAARARLQGLDLIVASDVDNPLLGAAGAATVFGPQKGADEVTVRALEERLRAWVGTLGDGVAESAGAGAAGGLGAALLAVGGRRRAGADVVAEATDRADVIARADLVVTGEGRYDEQTARGKVVAGLAAEAHGTPVIVLAGQVRGTPSIDGVALVRSVSDVAGSTARAMAEPHAMLAGTAARVASDLASIRGMMRE